MNTQVGLFGDHFSRTTCICSGTDFGSVKRVRWTTSLGTLNCTYEGFVSVVAIVGSFRTGSVGYCWAAAAAAVPEQIAQKVMVVVVVAVEFASVQIAQWVAAVVVSEFARIEMAAEVAVPAHSGQIETAVAAAVAAVYFAQRIRCFAGPAGSVVFGQISSFQPGLGFVCSH